MIPLQGWDNVEVVEANGLHPENDKSTVLNTTATFNPGENNIYAVLMLWKKSGEKWDEDDLHPVKEIHKVDEGKVAVLMKDDQKYIIQFN